MKSYKLNFNSNGIDPRTFTGLSPTFISFYSPFGTTYVPPGITEPLVGSGDYFFQYDIGQTTPIWFLVDGGATLNSNVRYLGGVIDQLDIVDQVVGYTGSSVGDTSVSPGTVMGFISRLREFNEGNSSFLKSSGEWSIYTRGSSTLLSVKTLTNSTTGVTKL